MNRKAILSLAFAAVLLLASCGKGETDSTISKGESSMSSSEVLSSDVQSVSSEQPADDAWYSDVKSVSIKEEIKLTAEAIKAHKTANDFSYIMLTDTHIDTSQSENNYELVLNTIEYTKLIAENCGIDAIVLGGDYVTGWRDKSAAINGLKAIGDAAKDSKVPVIIAKGNHDNNVNPDTKGNASEQVTDAEFYALTQEQTRRDNYVYDDSVKDGLYFYVDFPEKKTRLICLDAQRDNDHVTQSKWLAEKALTVKDDGWKYVIVTHIPIDERYKAQDVIMAGASDLQALMKGLNNRTTAHCSFGDVSFAGFKSQVVSCSFGHTHATYMEYNADLGVFCTSTGCGGAVGRSAFDHVEEDSLGPDNRQSRTNDDSQRYLFDIFLVNKEKIDRIRFGNGVDKTINLKAD